jgi:hypothetical protein
MITSEHPAAGDLDSHYQGRITLLYLRGREQLQTRIGRALFVIVHNQHLINSFLGRKPPTEDFLKKIAPDDEWDKFLVFGMAMYNAARFYAELSALISVCASPNSEIDIMSGQGEGVARRKRRTQLIDAIGKGIALDDNLTQSLASLPSHWHIETTQPWVDTEENDTGAAKPDIVFQGILALCLNEDSRVYLNMTRLVTLNQCSAVRIHLLHALAVATTLIDPPPPTLDVAHLIRHWEGILIQQALNITSSVNEILGEVHCGENDDFGHPRVPWQAGRVLRGYSLLWPLRAAVSVKTLEAEKRCWIHETLKYIEDTLDVRQATALARLAYWMDVPDRFTVLGQKRPHGNTNSWTGVTHQYNKSL